MHPIPLLCYKVHTSIPSDLPHVGPTCIWTLKPADPKCCFSSETLFFKMLRCLVPSALGSPGGDRWSVRVTSIAFTSSQRVKNKKYEHTEIMLLYKCYNVKRKPSLISCYLNFLIFFVHRLTENTIWRREKTNSRAR